MSESDRTHRLKSHHDTRWFKSLSSFMFLVVVHRVWARSARPSASVRLVARVLRRQVRAGMWKRNGNEVRLQEHVYHSSFWHEHSLNLDVLVLQLSLSVAPSGEQTALRIAEIFQMDAKSIEEIGRRMHAGDPDAIRSNRYLTKCHRDLMRLLVVLARERAHVGAREEAARLRRALVQWLCTGPQTHTKLVGNLSASLANHPDMQETLHAVAAYHQPNLQEQGCYSLRAECWREFDPYFPHFSVVQVEQALREAHASGAWDPAAQLRPFVPPLASLQGSMPVIQCHSNLGIIMYVTPPRASPPARGGLCWMRAVRLRTPFALGRRVCWSCACAFCTADMGDKGYMLEGR